MSLWFAPNRRIFRFSEGKSVNNQASMESSTGSFQLCHLADLRARPHTGGTPPNDWRIVSWNGAQVIHGNGAAQINHPTKNNEKSDIFSKSLASTKYTWKWKSLQIPHFQVFDVSFCCWCCWVFIATWSHRFVASRETPWFTLPKFWQQWAGTCCRLWRRAPQNSKGGKLYHRKDQTEKSQVSVSVIKWNEVCFFCDRLRTVKLAVNDQGGFVLCRNPSETPMEHPNAIKTLCKHLAKKVLLVSNI